MGNQAVESVPLAEVRQLRRQLHRQPELAFAEHETAATLRGFLDARGVKLWPRELAGTGLVAEVGSGPVLLLRAELDGLPLQEASGVEYAAKRHHHACGHDGHMAILAGAMIALQQRPPSRRVVAVFQPAEETGQGAEALLEDAELAGLDVAMTLSIHNLPGLAIGAMVVPDGAAAMASTGIEIRFTGTTSHASAPHLGRSPVPALSALSDAVAAAPAACLPTSTLALATVVGLHAGGPAYGTAPGSGVLQATLRAESDEALQVLADHVAARAAGLGKTYELAVEHEWVEPFPATRNDPDAAARCRAAAQGAGLKLVEQREPQPWSEDFGHFLAKWPGALVLLGSGDAPALHTPGYDFPDDALAVGIRFLVALAEAP